MGHWEDNGASDEWYTPKYIFDALGCVFDLDVAAPINRSHCHVPANRFITSDSLNLEWSGFVWMNPPFGRRGEKSSWFDKMYKHYNGIALAPDRTSAPWWQKAAKESSLILFVSRKIKFIRQDGTIGAWPGTGTTLFAYGDNAVLALYKAQQNNLGLTFKYIK